MRNGARKLMRRLLFLGVLGVLVVVGAALLAAHLLTAPRLRAIGPPSPSLAAEEVRFESRSESMIRGWWLPGRDPHKATLVLAHGKGGDRRAMLARAGFLRAAGYTALIFDFQAHGESPGKAITFGFRESWDVRAAVAFARQRRPERKVGIIGQSLGGAACLIGADVIDADALILESVYASLHEAIHNRMAHHFGVLGGLGAPLLTLQSRFRLGFRAEACCPIEGIARYGGPVLIIAGASDPYTPVEESKRLFEAAPGPKELWMVEGAGHVDYHGQATAEYEKRVLGFLERHL